MISAQIVFTESPSGRHWRGRLLNPRACVDTVAYNRPVTWAPLFNIEECRTGRFHVTMQGSPDRSGRRFFSYPSLDAAQAAGIRWAGRRFKGAS